MQHKFTFDGHGVNDATNEYKARVATLTDDYKRPEIGNLLAAAPAMKSALTAAQEWCEQYEDSGMDEWTRDILNQIRAALKLTT